MVGKDAGNGLGKRHTFDFIGEVSYEQRYGNNDYQFDIIVWMLLTFVSTKMLLFIKNKSNIKIFICMVYED